MPVSYTHLDVYKRQAYHKAQNIININCEYEDLGQYNNSLRIQGDAESVLVKLIDELKRLPGKEHDPAWLAQCGEKQMCIRDRICTTDRPSYL